MAKSWFKDNFFNFFWLILILLVLGGVFWAYTNGLYPIVQTQFVSSTDTNSLNAAPSITSDCSLTITPATITEGDDVTGIIWTRNPNTFCEVYGLMEGDDTWLKVAEGTTDIDGNLVATESFSVPGDFKFAALCNGCRTNDDDLHVNALSATTCTDTDGTNKLVAGWVSIDGVAVAYDECLSDTSVKEYICNGDTLGSTTLSCDSGYTCISTRSGGYCELDAPEVFACTDDDGGLNYVTRGICSSDATMTSIEDSCSGTNIINEGFCSPTGYCIVASIPCPAPFNACIMGECVLV